MIKVDYITGGYKMRNINFLDLEQIAGGNCPFLDAHQGETMVVVVMPSGHPDVSDMPGVVLTVPASAPVDGL